MFSSPSFQGFQQDSPTDRYNFTTVVVKVTDIDDNPPEMSSLTYNTSIMENTANGVKVLQIAATDPDEVRKLNRFVNIVCDNTCIY